jgi:hypothetical protein
VKQIGPKWTLIGDFAGGTYAATGSDGYNDGDGDGDGDGDRYEIGDDIVDNFDVCRALNSLITSSEVCMGNIANPTPLTISLLSSRNSSWQKPLCLS